MVVELGIVFGYENMGIVEEVGDVVSSFEVGDCVVVLFNVVCGFCENCENGYIGFCMNVNLGFVGGVYGYVVMGFYQGGQVEKFCILYVDFNVFKLLDGWEYEDLFVLFVDIFLMGWYGMEFVNFEFGDFVVIYGVGLVGLMIVYSVKFKGVVEIYVVDCVFSCFVFVEEYCDVMFINFEEGDFVEQIKEIYGGGVDKGVDVVGYQVIDLEKEVDFVYDFVWENLVVVINNFIWMV